MNNMAPPKSSGSTTARPKYPNTEEADENNLKINFLKMTETF